MELYDAWCLYVWSVQTLGVKVQKKVTVGLITILMLLVGVMFMLSHHLTFGMDEYMFYRLSNGLPNYSTSSDWIYVDNTSVLSADDPRGDDRIREVVEGTYNTPIYAHGPLAPALLWPAVKLFGNGIHIDEGGIFVLRVIAIGLSTLSFLLIYLIAKKRVGYSALLFAFPVMVGGRMLAGTMWVYWDVFMFFFFALTLYLMERPNTPKWLPVLTTCMMVNTKMFLGVLLVLPLGFKDRRLLLCTLSIIPWWVVSWVVTGDPIFWVRHYWSQVDFHNEIYGIQQLGWWLTVWRMDLVVYLMLTACSLAFIRKYPTYVTFYLITLLYGFGAGLGMSQISAVLYGGALVFPFMVSGVLRRVGTTKCPMCGQNRHEERLACVSHLVVGA